MYHANTNQKKARVLVSGKVVFRTEKITEDKEEHYIMIKGSLLQGYIIVLNICIFNNRALKYMS